MSAANIFDVLSEAANNPHADWGRIAAEICPRGGCAAQQAVCLTTDAKARGAEIPSHLAESLLQYVSFVGTLHDAARGLSTAAAIPTRDDASSYPGEEGLRNQADNLAAAQREAADSARRRLGEDLVDLSRIGNNAVVSAAAASLRARATDMSNEQLLSTLLKSAANNARVLGSALQVFAKN